jgi:hypothetical protein
LERFSSCRPLVAQHRLADHGWSELNDRAPVKDDLRHRPEMLGFLRPIGFMGAATTGVMARVGGDFALF